MRLGRMGCGGRGDGGERGGDKIARARVDIDRNNCLGRGRDSHNKFGFKCFF